MTKQAENLPRILLIDDSRAVRTEIRKQIRDKFDVREESDGESGWQTLLLDPNIEVVICALGMPRLNGLALLERIRNSRLSRISVLPVIFINQEDQEELRKQVQQQGEVDFITQDTPRVELLARLDVLTKLAQSRRHLNENTSQSTPHYHGNISVMVMEIDHYPELCELYGNNVGQLVHRKISRLLRSKVRTEDTVAHLAEGRFAVICPGANLNGCSAFALRMLRAIETIVMVYKEIKIQVSMTIGLASANGDLSITQETLIEECERRVTQGREMGGHCVIGEEGKVTLEQLQPEADTTTGSVDQALKFLREGRVEEVRKHLGSLTREIKPLLELMEAEYHCNIPIAQIAEKTQETTSIDPLTNTTFTSNSMW